eukprot:TRINITY_DN2713_c0_g1_i3.p1 TRINITY_DN2713_c0_g1~~TRINITY_DN2713_c0_g1_i3.p1  ORF type:complete len:462 (+),score=41.77 TRINITY_DN2713_c0_g1_i3:167-1552(+)
MTQSGTRLEDFGFTYWQLPQAYTVVLVDSSETLHQADFILKQSSSVALDAEWKPGSKKDAKAALLQVASRNKDLTEQFVFLFDLLELDKREVQTVIKRCFQNAFILKVGYGIVQDVLAISKAIGSINCVEPLVDLQLLYENLCMCSAATAKLTPVTGHGLSAMVCAVLNDPLDKEMQCSAWEERPLTPEQITYAAKDAAVLLSILDKLVEITPPQQFPMVNVNKDIDKGQQQQTNEGRNQYELVISNWGSKLELEGSRIRRSGWVGVGGRCRRRQSALNSEMMGRTFINPWEDSNNPKFICDSMMEGLARVLRSCGIDTTCVETKKQIPRHQIYRHLKESAEAEGRVILTGDRTFVRANYSDHTYLVQSNNKDKQLIEVLKFFGVEIQDGNLLSRCNKCNGQFLPPLTADELPPGLRISQHTLETQEWFWMCEMCHQVYWPGNMYDNAIISLTKNLAKLTT